MADYLINGSVDNAADSGMAQPAALGNIRRGSAARAQPGQAPFPANLPENRQNIKGAVADDPGFWYDRDGH